MVAMSMDGKLLQRNKAKTDSEAKTKKWYGDERKQGK
jgi:hypothetical protein